MLYWLIALFHLIIMPVAAVHALICKRDNKAALGWIGVILLFPVAGPLLYYIFGINRLRAKAKLFTGRRFPEGRFGYERATRAPSTAPDPLSRELPRPHLAVVGGRATGSPLLAGNHFTPLINGEDFFPRLLEAIEKAEYSVVLSSYLFSDRGVGGEVIAALARAADRGLPVYVLLDGVGTWYSLRRSVRALRRTKVHLALFTPPALLPPSLDINMRNHRKIAVVDDRVGFFGGINIDPRHMVDDPGNPEPTEDLHFLARGPVVAELRRLFERDWQLVTKRPIDLPEQSTPPEGDTLCRVIDDGPHDNLNHLSMTLTGVFCAARERIVLMTPYFLPNHEMVSALQAAALRGVRVQVVIPEKSNLRFVDWATRNMLWELVLWDIEVYAKPPHFAHTKLVVVDDHYVMAGSANLDARSLRLNFELGVEIFDAALASHMCAHVDRAIAGSHRLTLNELDGRPFWQRVRDAFFWLFSSYL